MESRPIILRLKGGLGNQLFQYATMRALSLRLDVELKLDVHTGFAKDPYHRKYMLGAFCIPVEVADADEVARHRQTSLPSWPVRRWLETNLRDQRGICYSPWLLTGIRRGSYVEGYWQSDKYFSSAADTLKKELRPRPGLRSTCSFAGSAPPQPQRAVVAVHARRLDFSSVCSTAYYQSACAYISRIHPNAAWYVFGDDHEWIENVLSKIISCTSIRRCGPDADIEEFCAMSSSQHFVIANSTFSWWAAWLGSLTSSIVVAPRSGWGLPDRCIGDLLPSHWVTL